MARKRTGPSQEFMRRLEAMAALEQGYPPDRKARLEELAEEAAEGSLPAGKRKEVRDIRSAVARMRKDYREIRRTMIPGRLLYDSTEFPSPPGGFGTGGPGRSGPGRLLGDRTLLTAERISAWDGYPPPRADDFRMELTCVSDPVWGVVDIQDTDFGVAGWASERAGVARVSNLNGKGVLEGRLTLGWFGEIPGDGRYSLAPGLALLHTGTCSTEGDPGIYGVDAEASAGIHCSLLLDETLLAYSFTPLSYASSRRRYDDDTDGMDYYSLHMSDRLAFDAARGQQLRLVVSLHGYTWTRGGGDAEVEIDLFGLISNTWSDTAVPVFAG